MSIILYCENCLDKSRTYTNPGVRGSSVVDRRFMVQWVIRSIPHGRLIELFLVSASASQLV